MSKLNIINNAFVSQPGNSVWKVTNVDCGTGANDVPGLVTGVQINGISMGSISPSDFPLTSTLWGTVNNPSGVVYGGNNNIQVNTSGLPLNGGVSNFKIKINDVIVYDQEFTSPYPVANNIVINNSDSIEILIGCNLNP